MCSLWKLQQDLNKSLLAWITSSVCHSLYTIVSHLLWISKFSSNRHLYVKLWLKLHEDLLLKNVLHLEYNIRNSLCSDWLHLGTTAIKQLFIYKAQSRMPLTKKQNTHYKDLFWQALHIFLHWYFAVGSPP